MCHASIDRRFYSFLFFIDRAVAERVQASRCPLCGEALDCAPYPRKPRGGPADLGEEYKSRFSFCCARCRHRTTPPSVRFAGRRVYLASTVVLVAAMQPGVGKQAGAALCAAMGVPWRTIRRWRQWWTESFVVTPFWKLAKAQFMPPVEQQDLPGSLLERFAGEQVHERLTRCLSFLSPLTTRCAIALTEGR